MADHKIYRFPNATVHYSPRHMGSGIILLDDGAEVAGLPDLLSEEVLKALGSYSHKIYAPTQGEIELLRSESTRATLSYVPKDAASELRELDEETYERLTPSFQIRYKRKFAEPVETRTPVEFELIAVPYELKGEFLTGKEFPTELHAKVTPVRRHERKRSSYGRYYGSDQIPAYLDWNLPLILSADEVLLVVDALGTSILQGVGYSATVNQRGVYSGGNLEVNFFAKPYEGATKKILDKKRNGGTYADQRGRMVRDLPTAVGKAEITSLHLSSWWESVEGNSLSDEAKLEALRSLTKHLWRV